jgi:DNA polymerase I-like protein with 3'-5' exonuclease and polymerase domains
MNVETTGVQWYDGDLPISIAVRLPDGSKHFLPWGYAGGNLDEATCKRWAQRELRDLHMTNIHTKFDIHQMYAWGIDLEAQNCTVSDVSHYAALLDDHRLRFNLDQLLTDYVGGATIPRVDESRMVEYHAAETVDRALYQVEAVHQLREVFWPMLDEQNLQRVRALEDQVIFPVCEMERNGAPIDVELLDKWIPEVKRRAEKALYDLAKMVGFVVNPRSPADRQRLWEYLHLPLEYLPSGAPSFTDKVVAQHAHLPAVRLMRYAAKLSNLNSKYLTKYRKNVDSCGILRYALHQLRTTKDPLSDHGGKAGTITGRFSSAALDDGHGHYVGINIQQEMKVAKQRVAFGVDEDDDSHDDDLFLIRQLRIPGERGRLWLAADAMQVEYRIFAHYANNPRVTEQYEGEVERFWKWVEEGQPKGSPNEPISFHKYMWSRIKPHKPDQTYRQQKDLNFAYVYGAQMLKQALMLGHISEALYHQIKDLKQWKHPALAATKEVRAIYDQELPEVRGLLDLASHLYMSKCTDRCHRGDQLHAQYEHRGYVTTFMGRRSRSEENREAHKAFNMVDQGGAADIMKTKIVELHKARKDTGLILRYTVHDEADGDVPDQESARRVSRVLNHQSFPELRIPILWDVSTGRNWKECA